MRLRLLLLHIRRRKWRTLITCCTHEAVGELLRREQLSVNMLCFVHCATLVIIETS